ncbi:MAG: hypothetical protein LBQ22_05585 [Bacteroidales bacterium]|jgi:hypothetical protein|nr:hypothetical protein [Bacteroidales bacterium]
MGYKNVEKHYDIKHIVAVHNKREYGGRCICIGSPYIHDIIVIRIKDAKIVKQYKDGKYNDGWSTNEDLARYNEAIKADEQNGVLAKLIDTPDTVIEYLPVFTIEKGCVVSDVCEEYGWPNTTHSGEIMYNNTYFKTRKEAYAYLLESTSSGVRYCNFKYNMKEAFERIGRTSKYGFMQCFYWVKARTVGRFYTKKIQL